MTDSKNISHDEEIEKLQIQIEEIQKMAQDNLAGWQRAQADYANFKKETEKRQKEVIEFANSNFMAEVLPVYSHFKLAVSHIPEEQQNIDWVVGVKFIKKQFEDFLKKYGIEEIETVGKQFNHELHEAIAHEEKEGFATDVIFEEVQPGYVLNGQVLIPARVKVAK